MKNPSIRNILLRAALIGLALSAAQAFAEPTFTVNSTSDDVDANPGDGACATSAGLCTLRAAIMEANRSSGVGATIVLPAGTYTMTIPATPTDGEDNGDLNLTAPASGNPVIRLIGAGAATTIVDANQMDRVLSVGVARTGTISGVKLRNGFVASANGGGILNSGTLMLADCVIENNRTDSGGAGIANFGVLTVARSTIRANLGYLGGGLYVHGPTTIRDSTIHDNGAGFGGGAEVSAFGSDSHMYAVNSTFSQNYADTNGGGIDSEGTTFLYNTSVVGNDADHNRDVNGGTGGGVYANAGSRFGVVNALIAGNTQSNAPIPNNCNGALEAYGLTLLDDPTGCTTTTSNANLGFVSLNTIGPLQDNGGPTWTHALLTGSEAIDSTIDSLGCVDETGAQLTADQRGAPSPAGLRCDVGAFEYGSTVPVVDLVFKDGFE